MSWCHHSNEASLIIIHCTHIQKKILTFILNISWAEGQSNIMLDGWTKRCLIVLAYVDVCVFSTDIVRVYEI